jgi:stage II sporulation protein D
MFKRYAAIITVFIFIVSLLPLGWGERVHAYSNSAYFNNLKVGLVSMSSPSVTITLNGDYDINGQTYTAGSVFNLELDGTSITFNGTLQSQLNIVPKAAENLLTITSGSVTYKYMGSFTFKLYNNKILPINFIDTENYLKGVVGYEMADNYPLEALKAQAIGARNYALSRIGYEAAKGYDFDDTISYQVYKGYNPIYSSVIAAVNQTRGQVLLYNDKLVETLYSAWHGGVSEDSENVWGNAAPYLRSVVDTFEGDPWPNGSRLLTNSQIQAALVTKGYLTPTDTFVQLDLSSITRFASGRVSNINIIYKDSLGLTLTKAVIRDSTRSFLSLPSNLYTVTYDEASSTYTFSGKGNGHGLGMSQIGAKNRAAAGQTYEQILKFYYQGTYVQSLIPSASLNALSLSSSALYSGSTISFNAAAAGGSGDGYLYKYVVKSGTTVVLNKDYDSISSLAFMPSLAGNYTVEAYVKDKLSILEYDDKKTAVFTVYKPIEITSLNKSVNNAFIGDAVNFSTSISGGSDDGIRYKYTVLRDGQLVTLRDFDVSSSFSYTPVTSGSYEVNVFVADTISAKPYEAAGKINFQVYNGTNLTNFSTNKTQYLKGEILSAEAQASLGSGSYLYKYVVAKDGIDIFVREYSSDSRLSYTLPAAGIYKVTVYAKDSLSTKLYENMRAVTVNVYSPVLGAVNVTGTFYEGKPLSIASSSTGVSPLGFSYRYEIYSGTNLIAASSAYGAEKFTFTPAVSGSYTVKVYGKDSLSTKAFDSVKTFNITVNRRPLYLSKLPLKYGMTSSDVAALQNALMKLGYSVSSASGYFGTQTKSAVIAFQRNKGLTADGVVGSTTYKALNDALILKAGVKSLTF